MAVDRFHKDKKDRAALRRAHAGSAPCAVGGYYNPTAGYYNRLPTDKEHARYWDAELRGHQAEQGRCFAGGLSSSLQLPQVDLERKTLIEAWLWEHRDDPGVYPDINASRPPRCPSRGLSMERHRVAG